MYKQFTTYHMECALMHYFNIRTNIIVPNVSWGMYLHECDLLIVTPSGYATEIEIKISKYDLIKDKDKKHRHASKKIKNLYFAIPDYLRDQQEHIPEHAGIIIVNSDTDRVERIRYPKPQNNYKWSEKEILKLTRLGTMRILSYRTEIAYLRNCCNNLKEKIPKK